MLDIYKTPSHLLKHSFSRLLPSNAASLFTIHFFNLSILVDPFIKFVPFKTISSKKMSFYIPVLPNSRKIKSHTS